MVDGRSFPHSESPRPGTPRPELQPAAEPLASTLPYEPLAPPRLALHEKHPMATRWMHWLNFPLLGS